MLEATAISLQQSYLQQVYLLQDFLAQDDSKHCCVSVTP
jgi:hypothetical protein